MFQFKIAVICSATQVVTWSSVSREAPTAGRRHLSMLPLGLMPGLVSVLILFFFLVDLVTLLMMGSRLPLMEAALWKEEFTYMKFGRSYTLRLPRR